MTSAVSHIVYRIAVTNKHTAKLQHVGSLYDARKLKHKIREFYYCCVWRKNIYAYKLSYMFRLKTIVLRGLFKL